MTPNIEPFFPDQISDKTAAILSEFLHTLAGECDARYANQLRRHYAKQHIVYDPDHPWLSPPSDK
jgi:hypothetical protein